MKFKTPITKTIVSSTFLLLIFFATQAFAEIIFQDNFENSPDWQSQQTVSKPAGGLDVTSLRNTCTKYCPPQYWTGYTAASSLWSDNRRLDTFILDSTGARGGSGKGITYNVENGTDVGAGWTGGRLLLWLGERGYTELYIRMFVKYPPDWIWEGRYRAANGLLQNTLQKLMRISTYNTDIYNKAHNPLYWGSSGMNYPAFIPDWYYNNSYTQWGTTFVPTVVKAPDYDSKGDGQSYTSVSLPPDNQWHCYEFHVKMNSVLGAADGVWEFYLDDVLQASRNNIVWKKTGADTSHNWNWLFFLDNVYLGAYPSADHREFPLYMDDVVVSTTRIGSKYVIAGQMGFQGLAAPAAPGGLRVQ